MSLPENTTHFEGTRILVVDDDSANRKLLTGFLEHMKLRVFSASDGYEGVLQARNCKPGLILMDVRMPRCDGLTACRALKADAELRQTPLIFLTGASAPEERVEGLLAGAVDYITKPFMFEEVRLRLAMHLPDKAPKPERQPELSDSALDNILFLSARNVILERLGHPPSLTELAEQLRTGTRHLNAAFKNCVGLTLSEYVREERMKEACSLLAETELEVRTIAEQLGFTSGANFATAFKDRYGISPTQFRDGRACPLPDSAPARPMR